jgi:hypothetical protein
VFDAVEGLHLYAILAIGAVGLLMASVGMLQRRLAVRRALRHARRNPALSVDAAYDSIREREARSIAAGDERRTVLRDSQNVNRSKSW